MSENPKQTFLSENEAPDEFDDMFGEWKILYRGYRPETYDEALNDRDRCNITVLERGKTVRWVVILKNDDFVKVTKETYDDKEKYTALLGKEKNWRKWRKLCYFGDSRKAILGYPVFDKSSKKKSVNVISDVKTNGKRKREVSDDTVCYIFETWANKFDDDTFDITDLVTEERDLSEIVNDPGMLYRYVKVQTKRPKFPKTGEMMFGDE